MKVTSVIVQIDCSSRCVGFNRNKNLCVFLYTGIRIVIQSNIVTHCNHTKQHKKAKI